MNCDKDKISVIIPCFNQGLYINEAVDSVLNQTYKNFEIIIVNDGSTDEFTSDLLLNYDKPNTKIFTIKNQGLASARNYGFEKSSGYYIQFLDADDLLLPTKLEEQIQVFNSKDSVDVCYTGYVYYNELTGELLEKNYPMELSNNPKDDFLYRWQRGLSIPIHCAQFKKDIWKNGVPFISGFKAIEDWIMWVGIAEKGFNFYYLEEDLAIYRIQGNNMTRKKSFIFFWVARAISYLADNYIDFLENENYELETEKYLEKLILEFYVNTIEQEKQQVEQEKQQVEQEIVILKKSLSYKLGRLFTWLPRKIHNLFQGIVGLKKWKKFY